MSMLQVLWILILNSLRRILDAPHLQSKIGLIWTFLFRSCDCPILVQQYLLHFTQRSNGLAWLFFNSNTMAMNFIMAFLWGFKSSCERPPSLWREFSMSLRYFIVQEVQFVSIISEYAPHNPKPYCISSIMLKLGYFWAITDLAFFLVTMLLSNRWKSFAISKGNIWPCMVIFQRTLLATKLLKWAQKIIALISPYHVELQATTFIHKNSLNYRLATERWLLLLNPFLGCLSWSITTGESRDVRHANLRAVSALQDPHILDCDHIIQRKRDREMLFFE